MSIMKKETIWTGNTFAIKNEIKSLGGRWDSEKKAWIVPPLTMKQRSEVYHLTGGLKGVQVREA